MTELETKFDVQLRRACAQAEALTGVAQTRLVRSADAHGAVQAVREQLRRRRVSDAFDALAQQGRLELSVEALAAQSRFGTLFSDDEVNFCFDLLCQAGFYGGELK